jgi:hypothetical protein
MKKGAFIIFSLLAILLVVLLFKSSRTTLSYSATCLACLQEVGGVEKSVLVPHSSKVDRLATIFSFMRLRVMG